jgi:hypothetical protein
MQTESGQIKFLELFTGMCEVFDKKYSKVLLNIYSEALKKYEIAKVEQAINNVITSCKFFPKPIDLLENLGEGKQALEDMAQIQASEVIKAISQYGSYESVKFKDKVTQAVIVDGFGSWIKMCENLLESNLKWFRKDFVSLYSSYARNNRTYHGILPGKHETTNDLKGYVEVSHINYVGYDKKPKEIERKTKQG